MRDAFMTAATVAPTDFVRNGRGQPMITPPDGGKPIPYNRPSSWGRKIEDTYNLDLWQKRMVVVGMSRTPALVAKACAITADSKEWTKADKDGLNAIATEATTAAKAGQAADIGTALHRMTERADLGETLTDLPEPYASDVAAYTAGMKAHGLTIEHGRQGPLVECRMVCDHLKLAGTADRVVFGDADPAGDTFSQIFDLKTGASIAFSGLEYAVQLAIYAHSDLYDIATGERTRLMLNHDTALIGHLPAGEGAFTLYEADIVAGWEAVLLCADIDRWRKRKGLLVAVPNKIVAGAGEVVEPAQGVTPPAPATPFSDEYKAARGAAAFTTPAEQIAALRVNPDEGGPADADAFAALQARYGRLTDGMGWLTGLVKEAQQHGVSFHSRDLKSVRRFEIIRGLVTLAEAKQADDDMVRAALAPILGEVAWFPTVTVGHLVGSLTADEAATFARLADEYTDLAA